LLPLTADFVTKIIDEEKPDGILLGFGGQTALNCGVELHERGALLHHGVTVLGTSIESIETATDREKFRHCMSENGIPIPRSKKANSIPEAKRVAHEIGYPVMVRVAYTLGGQGSGVAYSDDELEEIVSRGLIHSRVRQVLIEEYLSGWKEIEYEVVRDATDNCIIVCNMENLDPMGIHTGDSIVVAPSQTLTNQEYHVLREYCFRIVRALKIVGECNVQFALSPSNDEFRVIEVNSRLSRSSALASKATGYPIAYIAAKLALGYNLTELKNKVTGATTACFEPSLDYVVVKIPRWDFQKFKNVNRRIGTQMQSVGEIMGIGRSFEEALQKAVRMTDSGRDLVEVEDFTDDVEKVRFELENPSDLRLFFIVKALMLGLSIEEIRHLTKVDPWFLSKIGRIVEEFNRLQTTKLNQANLRTAKQLGYSDRLIGELRGATETAIRKLREQWGIQPIVKQIDTLAAESPAITNYLYLTYNAASPDTTLTSSRRVVVLGSGCYRIGSSVEFDWCCVNMAWALKKRGIQEVIMINCNPETVSTDFDFLDKLYFEELSLERVLDIIQIEKPEGVVVSVGGQAANNLAIPLSRHQIPLLGTGAEEIDRAEDRSKFSRFLDGIGIPQPSWIKATTISEAKDFASQVGYPVLVRPSYVLSGSAMNLAFNDGQLREYLERAALISRDFPVVVSKFLTNARELEVDAVCDGTHVFLGAFLEHVENAGVHSGDATISIPTLTITEGIRSKLRDYTLQIARGLRIQGPFNIQFLVRDPDVYVIECNLRASRSMPFVSKSVGVNLMEIAADAILRREIKPGEGERKGYAVKVPQFSFMRLDGADPVTGVEMVSTGEVACFGQSFDEALTLALRSSGMQIPVNGDSVLITVGGSKESVITIAKKFEKSGLRILSTENTARALTEHGIACKMLYKVSEGRSPNILDYLVNGTIKLVINIPSPLKGEEDTVMDDEYLIRRKAVEYGVPVITNLELASRLANALDPDPVN
jgi:carbamoyl-phosphate synthase large subunit